MKKKSDGLRTIDLSLKELHAWPIAGGRRRVAKKRLKKENGTRALDPIKVAAFARRLTETVFQALRTGALPGKKVDSGWLVSRRDMRVWVNSGCPITPSAKVG